MSTIRTSQDELLVHTFETDTLPEEHPWARVSVGCGRCSQMVHAFNNECMQEWCEWDGHVLCLDCASPLFNGQGLTVEAFRRLAPQPFNTQDSLG